MQHIIHLLLLLLLFAVLSVSAQGQGRGQGQDQGQGQGQGQGQEQDAGQLAEGESCDPAATEAGERCEAGTTCDSSTNECVPDSPEETEGSIAAAGVRVQVRGQSGKMTLTADGDGGENPTVVECQMVALRQVDESGNTLGAGGSEKQSFNSFATQTFTFSEPFDTTYQGLAVSEIEFESVLARSSNVNIRTMIFKEGGTLEVGDDTFQVTQGAVKFNVELSSWSWCGDDGVSCVNADGVGAAVELDLDMYARGNTPEIKAATAGSSSYTLGGGPELVLLSTFSIDGGTEWVQMPDGFPSVDGSVFTLKFPRWPAGESVLYDPIIQYSETGQLAEGESCDPATTDADAMCEPGTTCDSSTNECVRDPEDCTDVDTPYAGCLEQDCTAVDAPYAGCLEQDCTDVDAPYAGCIEQDCTAVDVPYAGCVEQDCTAVDVPYAGCLEQDCTAVDAPYAGCLEQDCTDVDAPYAGCLEQDCTAVDVPYAGCVEQDCTAVDVPYAGCVEQDCTAVDAPYAGCVEQDCTDVNAPYAGCVEQDCTAVDVPYAGCIAPPSKCRFGSLMRYVRAKFDSNFDVREGFVEQDTEPQAAARIVECLDFAAEQSAQQVVLPPVSFKCASNVDCVTTSHGTTCEDASCDLLRLLNALRLSTGADWIAQPHDVDILKSCDQTYTLTQLARSRACPPSVLPAAADPCEGINAPRGDTICESISGAWHQTIDPSGYDGGAVCFISAATGGDNCQNYCAALGRPCMQAQDNAGDCGVGGDHTRQTTEENGCLQNFSGQICGCGMPGAGR